MRWSKYDQAISHFQEALRRYEALEELTVVANTLAEMGELYVLMGRFAEALQHDTRCRDLLTVLDRPADVAFLTRNMGWAYREWGKLDEALRHYEQALARFDDLALNGEQARTLQMIGQAHQCAGDFPRAVAYLTQCRDLYEQLGNSEEVIEQWGNLAEAYRDWGRFADAIQCHEQALTLSAEAELTSLTANEEGQLAYTYASNGQYAAARDWFARSQETYRSLGRIEAVALGLEPARRARA